MKIKKSVVKEMIYSKLAEACALASAINEYEVSRVIEHLLGSMVCHNERLLWELTSKFAKKEILPKLESSKLINQFFKDDRNN